MHFISSQLAFLNERKEQMYSLVIRYIEIQVRSEYGSK